jgi:hypothetical protein
MAMSGHGFHTQPARLRSQQKRIEEHPELKSKKYISSVTPLNNPGVKRALFKKYKIK